MPVMADLFESVTVRFPDPDIYNVSFSFIGSFFDPTPEVGSFATTVSQKAEGFSRDVSFTSHLDIPPPDSRVRAQLLLNDTRSETTDNSRPFRHQFRGRSGENRVEGRIISEFEGEAYWRLDFAGADHFVPGSLNVEMGSVLTVNSYQVVFRLSGSPGERIRFTYRLSQ